MRWCRSRRRIRSKQPPPNDRTIVVQVIYRPGAAPTYKINETEVAKTRLAGEAD